MTRTHCALPVGGFWGREKSRRASERREAVSFPILFSRFMLHNGEPLGRAMSVTTLRDSRTHWNPRTPEGNKEKGGTTVHRRTGDEVAINGDYQDKALTRDPVVGRFWHYTKQLGIREFLPPAPGDQVIDVGCGPGTVTWFGFKRVQLQFVVPNRVSGRSRWSFLGLVRLGLMRVTVFFNQFVEACQSDRRCVFRL